jgi:predicted transcriptional regulator
MEELNKLCEELDIDLSNLQTLSDQNKSKLYDILQDNEILIKAKEIGMQPNDFTKRLLINNPMI